MNWLTKHFRVPQAQDIALRELHDTARELLNAHTRCEQYTVELRSCESHIDILRERQKRLAAYLGLEQPRN